MGNVRTDISTIAKVTASVGPVFGTLVASPRHAEVRHIKQGSHKEHRVHRVHGWPQITFLPLIPGPTRPDLAQKHLAAAVTPATATKTHQEHTTVDNV